MTNILGVHRHEKKSGQKYVLSFLDSTEKTGKKNSKVPLMSYLQKTGSKRRRKQSDDMKMQQNSPTQEKIHKYINKLSSAKLHF